MVDTGMMRTFCRCPWQSKDGIYEYRILPIFHHCVNEALRSIVGFPFRPYHFSEASYLKDGFTSRILLIIFMISIIILVIFVEVLFSLSLFT